MPVRGKVVGLQGSALGDDERAGILSVRWGWVQGGFKFSKLSRASHYSHALVRNAQSGNWLSHAISMHGGGSVNDPDIDPSPGQLRVTDDAPHAIRGRDMRLQALRARCKALAAATQQP